MKNKKIILKFAALSLLPITASAQEKINKDSVYRLPVTELYKYMQKSHTKPVKIEYDTVKITDTFKPLQNMSVASYDRIFNTVVMYHFITSNPDCRLACDELNSLDKESLLTHEMEHATKDSIENFARMDLKEIVRYRFHMEAAAMLAEFLKKQNSLEVSVSKALHTLEQSQEFYATESIPAVLEADLIFVFLFQKEHSDKMKKQLPVKKLKTYEESVRALYTFDNVCVLDKLKPDTRAKLFNKIEEFSDNKFLVHLTTELSSKHSKICQSCQDFRQAYSGMMDAQKLTIQNKISQR